jgi:hypothetical protein
METYVLSDLKAAVATLGEWNENKIVICAQFILLTICYEKIKDLLGKIFFPKVVRLIQILKY